MKINKKGFTLIELLGVIAVVSLVLGLSIYGIGKIIENSKAKSEEISISGIERAASTYSGESEYGQWQLKDKKEYFCITVGELVNKGMLKKDSVSGKTNYDLSSYVAVVKDYDTRVLEKSKLILNSDTSSTEYQVCTGTVTGDGETAALPNISGGSTYTDEIVSITFTDGSTNLSDKVIDGSRKCFYGTSSSNINNNDNVIVDEVNKKCSISKLLQNKPYYVKVCMGLTSGAYVCSNTNEYKTKSIAKPTISIDSSDLKVTITYSGSNIKGNHYNYFYSPIAGTSNKNVVSCTERNNVMTCSESSTTTITKNTWYRIGEKNVDAITLTYSGEDNGTLKARTYDKTNNYSEGTKGLKINKIEFKKGTADKIGGGTSDIAKKCLAEGNNGCDITSPTIEREHHSIIGWNTDSTATTSTWNINTSKTVKESTTYYPITKLLQYTITYDANGGSGAPASQTKTDGINLTLSSTKPTREYYTFTGWKDGDGTSYAAGGTYSKDKAATLTAQWRKNKAIIYYYADGGTILSPNTTGTTHYWRLENDKISMASSANGPYEVKVHNVEYGCIGSCGNLANYNNTDYIYITKSGYHVNGGQEWACKSNNCSKTVYNQDMNYSATDFCDMKASDCTIEIKVNWQQDSGGGNFSLCDDGYYYDYSTMTCKKTSSGGGGSGGNTGGGGGCTDCDCINKRCKSNAAQDCYYGYTGCSSCGDYAYSCNEAGGCFLAETKVVTTNGYKDIDKLNIGDMVLTYNEKAKQNEYNKVLFVYVFNNLNEKLYTLTFDDETAMQITSTHRLYVKRRGTYLWLPTKSIIYGDSVKYADGTYHKIKKISYEELHNTVYNITVDNTHNFYVGNQKILVHNVITTDTGTYK